MDNRNISNNIDETSIDYKDIQKMIFIYNALNDGWTVRKIDIDKFELLKDKEKIKKEIILDECIKNYINYKITNR
jgi:uncharacterized protein YjhX (UPF0386 family)